MIILVDTKTQVKHDENTFPSHKDRVTKSNDANGRSSLPTVIIGLSLFAFILMCIYVSTFAVTFWPRGIENNVVLEIYRNSEQV